MIDFKNAKTWEVIGGVFAVLGVACGVVPKVMNIADNVKELRALPEGNSSDVIDLNASSSEDSIEL